MHHSKSFGSRYGSGRTPARSRAGSIGPASWGAAEGRACTTGCVSQNVCRCADGPAAEDEEEGWEDDDGSSAISRVRAVFVRAGPPSASSWTAEPVSRGRQGTREGAGNAGARSGGWSREPWRPRPSGWPGWRALPGPQLPERTSLSLLLCNPTWPQPHREGPPRLRLHEDLTLVAEWDPGGPQAGPEPLPAREDGAVDGSCLPERILCPFQLPPAPLRATRAPGRNGGTGTGPTGGGAGKPWRPRPSGWPGWRALPGPRPRSVQP